ncbi:glycoside hydrolase family 1 protein [Stereum hirsutum FP-91666 SS1]|uniref:glycoside hydrolase family 1 protein n=1 Tax=Stereum hirsutum (strain FP-91666) TaxID=721885 RepID=UPI000440A9B7|nr:glycoside hydrolase family 1 protein [Stereum hirsutum FP-91666 SS1]EIM91310.1 glycoside hydrolase family 1 protein [Stereum hirsutum FP-91666 SS1]
MAHLQNLLLIALLPNLLHVARAAHIEAASLSSVLTSIIPVSSASVSVVPTFSSPVTSSNVIFSTPTTTTIASTTPTAGGTFPPVGSITKDFSPSGLSSLWDVVGPVTAPPFTTTVEPSLPIVLPSAPPALYPDFFSPGPAGILPDLKFPEGFKFGVATAAFQVEGAVKDGGKGPSMWDWTSHQPGAILDGSNADVVDLQYYMYKEDVARTAALGVNAHSFSISWARIFPFATADSPVNQEALDHYSDLIDYHNSMGVEPVVTLFHWDTPLAAQAYYGGFTSANIVDDYVNYAKTVFQAYNGRVKTWYTFNEPRVFCSAIAGWPFNDTFAPGVNSSTAPFQCAYNLLKSHVGAVKAFKEMNISGEIAFKNDDFVGMPWRWNNSDDVEAVERHAAFQIGIFSDPVYATGDWPQILLDTLPEAWLPRFTDEEKKELLGAADFFAIDPYRTQYIVAPEDGLVACVNNMSHPLWPQCNTPVMYDSNAGWAVGPSPDPLSNSWLQATPQFVRSSFKQLRERWNFTKMYVSEFGFVEPFEEFREELFRITEDVTRTNYLLTYLGEILLSIHEDGMPIAGAFTWAMVDNFEWNSGLSAKFGIQYVNYSTQERTYKRSAMDISAFMKAHLQNSTSAS